MFAVMKTYMQHNYIIITDNVHNRTATQAAQCYINTFQSNSDSHGIICHLMPQNTCSITTVINNNIRARFCTRTLLQNPLV